VTPEEARKVARRQNDADHAEGLLPSRHVEDEAVLAKIARLVLASGEHDGGSAEPGDADDGPRELMSEGRRRKQTVKSSRSNG
jgi:hypothetical protein